MKLYKIDFTNTIGDYMVTVPTDSQFLVGIGNGDVASTARLYDGETEITPEADKIGEYTCFRFETNGTPFRKPYKAVINGFNPVTKYWDAHEYDITDGTLSATIAIVDDDVFAKANADDPTHPIAPTATSLSVKFKDETGNYSTTLVYTFDKVALAGGIPSSFFNAPVEIDEEIANAYPIPKIIRFKNAPVLGWNWNKIEANYTGQSSIVNWKATPLVSDIKIPYEDQEAYTQEIDILIICQKMSVAYRDFEGNGGGAVTPYVFDTTTSVVQVTPDNLATIDRTIYTASINGEDYSMEKSVTFVIDEDAFSAIDIGATEIFVGLKIRFNLPGLQSELPSNWWNDIGRYQVRFTNTDGDDYGDLANVATLTGTMDTEVAPSWGHAIKIFEIVFYRPFDNDYTQFSARNISTVGEGA